MEVRSLEAVFGFKFDGKKLKEAIKSVDGFANNVNTTINSLAKKMPPNTRKSRLKIFHLRRKKPLECSPAILPFKV
jgi:hypothetical protein